MSNFELWLLKKNLMPRWYKPHLWYASFLVAVKGLEGCRPNYVNRLTVSVAPWILSMEIAVAAAGIQPWAYSALAAGLCIVSVFPFDCLRIFLILNEGIEDASDKMIEGYIAKLSEEDFNPDLS